MSSTTKNEKTSVSVDDASKSETREAEAGHVRQERGRHGEKASVRSSTTRKHRNSSSEVKKSGHKSTKPERRHHDREDIDDVNNMTNPRHDTKPSKTEKMTRSKNNHHQSKDSKHRHHHHSKHHHHHHRHHHHREDLNEKERDTIEEARTDSHHKPAKKHQTHATNERNSGNPKSHDQEWENTGKSGGKLSLKYAPGHSKQDYDLFKDIVAANTKKHGIGGCKNASGDGKPSGIEPVSFATDSANLPVVVEPFEVDFDSIDDSSSPRDVAPPIRDARPRSPVAPGAVAIDGPDAEFYTNDDFTLTGRTSYPRIQNPANPTEPVSARIAQHDDEDYDLLQREYERIQRERDNVAMAEVIDPHDIENQQEEFRTTLKQVVSRKRIWVPLVAVVLTVVAIATALGIVQRRQHDSPANNSLKNCSFCYDGRIPLNLETNMFDDTKKCSQYMNETLERGLYSDDPECITAQVIAWRQCECPTIPPKALGSSCYICGESGVDPIGVGCREFDSFLSHVEPQDCEELISSVTCMCEYPYDLADLISSVSFDNGAALQTYATPQNNAFEWLATNTNLDSYSDDRKIQRYALATLYYSTNGDSWLINDGWLGDSHECYWFDGVLFPCSNGTVEILMLPEHGLEGTLPAELALLSNSLVTMDLSDNDDLTGTIPMDIGRLINLQSLDLYSDSLRGSLTGTIPSEIGLLTNLNELALCGNRFTGKIPSEIGLSTNLDWMGLHYNRLTGAIPSEIVLLTKLTLLALHKNALTGSIPSEIGLLTKLTLLSLHANALTGSIPSEIGLLTNLEDLYLDGNSLTGTIPSEIHLLTNLIRLDLFNNFLTGEFTCPDLIDFCYISCLDESNTIVECRSL